MFVFKISDVHVLISINIINERTSCVILLRSVLICSLGRIMIKFAAGKEQLCIYQYCHRAKVFNTVIVVIVQ